MRVDAEAGFLLHATPYRETSLLVDLFSQNHGRIRCVAKGFRKPNKRGISRAIFPYTEHQFSWQGRGELKTLTSADAIQAHNFLQQECLFTGLYVNELLYRLLHEHDPHEHLYEKYAEFMVQLAGTGPDELMLRQLEMTLLDELGYGLVLDCEAKNGSALLPDKLYQYVPEQGLIEAVNQRKEQPGSYRGADIMALTQGDFSQRSVMKTAKQLLRNVINFYLGGRQLHSRELYRQHLMSVAPKQEPSS
ncbi:DNA repair protein RecO [Porticoccaceae bacterium]|nr:DNA repair protein RecO [Porticoccaceae bacterium]MDB4076484.1 DNA repair protein RecO [Porticoccaceae bacterium]MDB9952323.1 DNA repair protein RecO [Porticoccaceae bacterium]MDC0000519.1 DNA repair protein RecO [Porticoccaceae bacterium]